MMPSLFLDSTGEITFLWLKVLKVPEDPACGLEPDLLSLNLSRIFPLEVELGFLWKSFWLIKYPDKKAVKDRDITVNVIKSFWFIPLFYLFTQFGLFMSGEAKLNG